MGRRQPRQLIETNMAELAVPNPPPGVVIADESASHHGCVTFVVRWISISLAPTVLPIVLTLIVLSNDYQNQSRRLAAMYYIAAMIVMFVFLGAGQWIVLRRHLAKPFGWAAATVAGLVFGCGAAALAYMQVPQFWWMLFQTPELMIDLALPPGTAVSCLSSATAGGCFGLTLGALQALTLRVSWRFRAMWIAISVLALTCAFAASELQAYFESQGMLFTLGELPTEQLFWLPRVAIGFCLPMLIYACLTSPALWFILMRSRNSSMSVLLDRFD